MIERYDRETRKPGGARNRLCGARSRKSPIGAQITIGYRSRLHMNHKHPHTDFRTATLGEKPSRPPDDTGTLGGNLSASPTTQRYPTTTRRRHDKGALGIYISKDTHDAVRTRPTTAPIETSLCYAKNRSDETDFVSSQRSRQKTSERLLHVHSDSDSDAPG